jgi:adenylate cyclase
MRDDDLDILHVPHCYGNRALARPPGGIAAPYDAGGMTEQDVHRTRYRERANMALTRLVSIADTPGDDDARIRKRVGVVAGYMTALAPFALPVQAQGHPVSWVLAVAMSTFSVGNLLLLRRSRRFTRYIVGLIAAGTIFVPLATAVGGGITGASTGLVWGFLVPAYAILALGPERATPWFVAYIGTVAAMVAVDPLVRSAVGPTPYVLQLVAQTQNSVVPLTIAFLLLRYTDVRRRRAEARADDLLTNAIPAAIATRLKRGEQRIAETYEQTTVVFADLVGFTPWAQRTDPARVVAVLDGLFSRFDELTELHGLEKIKTIGDAYMAVAGAPEPQKDHAVASLEFARSLLDAMAEWRATNRALLELRVGLASGPVVAGVIGQRRIVFDLWGDTVNLAARMESSGVPGRVQVAASTRELVGSRFLFEGRYVDVKGLGTMTTYLLVDGTRVGVAPA